jgi:hypothetical protein
MAPKLLPQNSRMCLADFRVTKIWVDVYFIMYNLGVQCRVFFVSDSLFFIWETFIELWVKSACLHYVFGPAFTPYALFQWYPQSEEILLKSQVGE